MASDFVRNIKGIRNIDILSPNITTENDIISTIDGKVYVATNKGYKKITGSDTEQDIQVLETYVKNLKTSTGNNTSEIETLKTSTGNNTSEIETLKTETNNNKSEIETLKTSTDNNTSEIETLKTSTDNNTSEIETLKTDTSKHQKYKLTESNGDRIRVSDIDPVELDTGFYQTWNTYNMPVTEDDSGSYWNMDVFSAWDTKQIKATLNGEGRVFQKNIHFGKDKGWKELTGMTRTVLFEGSAKTTGELITLNQSYENFTELKVKVDRTGTREIYNFDAENDAGFAISYSNIYNDNSEGKLYEMIISKKSPTELEIKSQRAITFSDKTSDDSGITILKIWGIT